MSEHETRLMLSVRAGSRDAFEELYQLYQKPLANYLHRLSRNPQRVDDLLQEIFLRVWKAAPRYQPRAKVSTWIFQIAHNLWINDSLKRREQGLDDRDPAHSSAPEENLEREELRGRVRAALEAIPEGEREVLILAEYNGLRYEQISEILSIPVGTVKSRVFHATRRLRELLASDRDAAST